MLSESAILLARNAIEKMYTDTCTITERQKVKENGVASFQDIDVITNQKCRLSFSSIKSANQGDGAASITQIIKLFISKDIEIKEGSKITVLHEGKTLEYKQSGVPAIYPTHQEIVLELCKRWS